MNLIAFFKEQIEKFNGQKKCDFCWFFGAPLTESRINQQQLREGSECCVQVLFTQDRGNAFNIGRTYRADSPFVTEKSCNQSFSLWFLIPSSYGINNFNEIRGYSDEEGRAWLLMKLQECISCDIELDFCEILEQEYEVTNWVGTQVIDKFDNMYIGYRVDVTLRLRE